MAPEAPRHRVYLVPGFFGFTHMGGEAARLLYFEHVREFLLARFQERGLRAEVVDVASHPTAGLDVRAQDVIRAMGETATGDDATLHLIGHSTGGLDARNVVSARLAAQAPGYVQRVRTVVSVATPHHGTPLATFFHQDKRGETMLRLLSIFTLFALRRNSPFKVLAFRLFYEISRAGDSLGFGKTLPDLIAHMLADLPPEEYRTLTTYLDQLSTDQGLIRELMPDYLEGFNRDTPDVPGVRYGSVVTGAQPPSAEGWSEAVLGNPQPNLTDLLSLRLLDPEPQMIYGAYSYLYLKATQGLDALHAPVPSDAQATLLRNTLGNVYPNLCDGIVPTRSQVWGELLHVARADHLDVLGHFDEPPGYVSWLKSGSHFRRTQFEALWQRVFDFLVPPGTA